RPFVVERPSSAVAAAPRAVSSQGTWIAAAVGGSALFGVGLHHHKLPLPHPRCNARILYVHSITDDQLPDLFAPRRVPKILEINQPIASNKEQEPGVNEQARLGTVRFIGHTRRVVDDERVIALHGPLQRVQILRRPQLADAARAKTRLVRQPQPLDDRTW